MGQYICRPKFLARPEFMSPGRNFGLEFWPGKNKPKISAWNSRPEFQAEMSSKNVGKKLMLLLGRKPIYIWHWRNMNLWFLSWILFVCRGTWVQKCLQINKDVENLGLEFWPENFGLEFCPVKNKPKIPAWKTGQNSKPKIPAWNVISACRCIAPKWHIFLLILS